MKYIQCGSWNSYYKFIIFSSIFQILTELSFGYVFDNNLHFIIIIPKGNQVIMSKHVIFHYIFRYIFLSIISLFIFLYQKYCVFKERNTFKRISNIQINSSIKLIYNDKKEELNINVSPFIFVFVTSIMVLKDILNDLFYRSYLRSLDFWMFELLLISYIANIILNFSIFRHHLLVICINIIICLPIKIFLFIFKMYNTNKH
jgi:hypothetical protein